MIAPDEIQTKPLLHSGIPGLDQFLGGGLPEGKVIILLGEPGSGKTCFCSQFLFAGANSGKGVSLFIGMNEPKARFIEDMNGFGIDFASLEVGGRFAYVDALNARRGPILTGKDFDLPDMVKESIQKYSPKRIAVDSTSDLIFRYPKIEERLPVILDLVESLQSSGATCLLTVEHLSRGDSGLIQPEEFLADGIILLKTGDRGTRSLQVLKMRGVKIDPKPKPYDINEKGVEVYANEEFLP